jgi:hypothetical protein
MKTLRRYFMGFSLGCRNSSTHIGCQGKVIGRFRNRSGFMKLLPVPAAVLAVMVLLTAPVQADTLFFRATLGSLWSTVTNWYLADGMGGYVPAGRLPNAPDNVILLTGPDGQAGVFQVNTMILEGVGVMNGAYSAQTIQMAGSSSFTASTITVLGNGEMEVLAGGGCALTGVNLTIQGGASLYLTNGAFLTLGGGTLIYDEGGVILTDGSVINGVPGTNTLEILPGAELLSSGKATVEIVGYPGQLTINNSGTVVCNSGFLELSGSMLISTNGTGKFQTVAPTAFIYLDPPDIGPGSSFVFTGPGTIDLGGATIQGTVQVGAVDSGTGLFVPGNLAVPNAMQILGSGLIHVMASNGLASTFSITNSSFNATTIEIDQGALFNIVGAAAFTSNLVNNAGTILWSNTFGSPITLAGATTFNNLSGGSFIEADDEAGILQAPEPLISVFNNLGSFRILSGSSTVSLGGYSMLFNNNGLLDVQSGSVNLRGGSGSGQFNLASGTTLAFTGPTNIINSGATFTGTGSFQVNGSTFMVDGDVTIPNLTLESFSTIDGPGQLTVSGNCAWNGGTIQGAGTFIVAAGSTLTIGSQGTLNQRTLNNSGAINLTSPYYVVAGGGAVINNLAGALFTIQSTPGISSGAAPLATFNNFGTVQKTASTGSSVFYLNFNNAGSFQVLTQSVSFPYTFQQTAGSTVISADATFSAGAGFNLLGGTLSGDGTISAPVTNSGVISPGMSPGILTLSPGFGDSYTQSTGGILNIVIGGVTPGTQYSQFAAAGCPVNLGGSLNVNLINGFVPSPGQQFTILTCGSRTGTFPVKNGILLNAGTGLVLVPLYSTTNVVLLATNESLLQPALDFARSGNNLQLTWPSVMGQAYQVEYSSDLFQWLVLSNLVASAGTASVVDPTPIPGVPKRFYRLR